MGSYDPNETFGEFLERTPDWKQLDPNPLVAWSKDLNRRQNDSGNRSNETVKVTRTKSSNNPWR